MNMRYGLLTVFSVPMMFGMMTGDTLPLSGDAVHCDELPASLILLLQKYPLFKMLRHSYQLSSDGTILAITGAEKSVKVFKKSGDSFVHLQHISSCAHPAVHPQGNALAVVNILKNNERAVAYYVRKQTGLFEQTSAIPVDKPIGDVFFDEDGTQLVASVLVATNKYDQRQFVKNSHNQLIPKPQGLIERLWSVFE